MSFYSLSHLSDSTLLYDLAALVARDRATTAALLAHLAEVDERRLYLPAAYPSLYAYCVGELRMSEDTAYKRIRAARMARECPAIFTALADGRLNLSSVLLLTPYLTPDTADGLLAAAAHRTNAEIELFLAGHFPRTDVPTRVEAMAATTCTDQLAVRPVDVLADQLSPPMKTGCQGSRLGDPFVPRPSLTSRLFGVRLLPQESLRKSRVPHGETGFAPKGISRDHLLRIQRRLR